MRRSLISCLDAMGCGQDGSKNREALSRSNCQIDIIGHCCHDALFRAKVVSHGRYIAFQMAEVAIPRRMFQEILRLIAELRPKPPPAPASGGQWSCVQG